MSDFIFKVPELPEDALFKKRKNPTNCFNQKESNENWTRKNQEFTNSSQALSIPRMRDYNELRPVREGVAEDFVQPSTSQYRKDVHENSNKNNFFQSSFGRFGNQSFAHDGDKTKYKNLMDSGVRGIVPNTSFNNASSSRITSSIIGSRMYRDSVNFSTSHNYQQESVLNSCFRINASQANASAPREMNSHNYFNHGSCKSVNNGEPSLLSNRKSLFGREFFPEKSRFQKSVLDNGFGDQFYGRVNSYESMNKTCALPKDSTLPYNVSQSIIDNQLMMKSILQPSIHSMKEQVMNTLENFGQALLRNAPNMETSFFKVAKEVKSILENSSMFLNPVTSTTGMASSLNYTSEVLGCQHQSILQNQGKGFDSIRKPSNILKEIQGRQNELPTVEFVESFTVKQRKQSGNCGDAFGEKPGFNTTSQKQNINDEVDLWNWYPVVQENGLAFIGTDNENVKLQTSTMRERINNRRILLEDGRICNLVGKPSSGKKFPSEISKKIRNGLHSQWRMLLEAIAKFQKSSQKENADIVNESISTDFETSTNTSTLVNRNTTKSSKINAMIACKSRIKDDFALPTTSKPVVHKPNNKNQSKILDNNKKMDGAKGSENKEKSNEKVSGPVQNDLLQKSKSSRTKIIDQPVENEKASPRIVCTTRSGRVVRAPGNMWNGGNFNENHKENERNCKTNSEKEKTTLETPKINTVLTESQLKRKREAAEKCVVEVKKKKSEKQKQEENSRTKTRQSTRLEKNEKSKGKSDLKLLDSTVTTEKAGRNKSPPALKTRNAKKAASKYTVKKNSNRSECINPWGNEFEEGLNDIVIPEISIHNEEVKADAKKMKMLTVETPPLKFLRSHLKILKTCTPIQSPHWQPSQHTQSEVKKFEKIRAQTFKKKIPKNNAAKNLKKENTVRNKDVETVLNWIGEREIRSPKQCSNLIKYVIRKKSELEEEEEDNEDTEEVSEHD